MLFATRCCAPVTCHVLCRLPAVYRGLPVMLTDCGQERKVANKSI